jgi:uncharacterized protein (DUF1501 family)
MTDQPTCCDEYAGASRRGFLRGALGAAAGAAAVSATFGDVFTSTAYAATGTAESVMVVLSLRGAVDGMSLVVPHGDPVYYSARPRIAVPSEKLLVKDGMFGLHPNLAPLVPMWKAGKLAAVQATGLHAPNRSHFSAMEEVEDADAGSSARVGWLNRMIGRDTGRSPLQAIQMGDGVPPASLYGPEAVLATRDVNSVQLRGANDPDGRRGRVASLNTTWGNAPGPLGKGARSALQVVKDFKPVQATSAKPQNGANYPTEDIGDALAGAARAIRADVGAEVITVDYGSWDMHMNLGDLASGEMRTMSSVLGQAMAAFFTDLGPLGDKVTLVTISEFGRRVKENANRGLDHGYGNVMFLAGAGVKGGKFYGNWPGLEGNTDSDLLVTTDYRSVLNEVARSRFNASTAQVFPGFQPERIGVMAGQ